MRKLVWHIVFAVSIASLLLLVMLIPIWTVIDVLPAQDKTGEAPFWATIFFWAIICCLFFLGLVIVSGLQLHLLTTKKGADE